MAIELSDDLIQLQRSAVEAQREATVGAYSAEAWKPWLEAAEKLHAEITAHAEATGQSRFAVEAALKKAVLHSEADSES
ncbi:hypothetical protein ACGFMM_01255 [Streptomyces sp. NPDC048604]|uniref:hypothetical protein n=1 Tax=Streptomyces sp. NPDC048604 TaxID=3365578 RepID=UPI003713D8D3